MNINRYKSILKTLFYVVKTIKCVKNSTFLSAEETVSKIIQEKKSLIRYGDGEFFLMRGNSIHYQEYTKELGDMLEYIIKIYLEQKRDSYLLAMPGKYFLCNSRQIWKSRLLIRSWVYPRYIFKKKFDTNVEYGEAFLFTQDNRKYYEKIWLDKEVESIIFVHNDIKYANEFSVLYKKKVYFVKVPSRNAYRKKEEILNEILTRYKEKKGSLILISAGPCAKYLVLRLSEMGIWAIDTGHCWDEPLI